VTFSNKANFDQQKTYESKNNQKNVKTSIFWSVSLLQIRVVLTFHQAAFKIKAHKKGSVL